MKASRESCLSPPHLPRNEVTRLYRPGPTLFQQQHQRKEIPVVIEGVVDTWPAFSKWDPGYLKSRCGHHRVTVEVSPRPGFRWRVTETREMQFRDFVDRVFDRCGDGRFYYLRFATLLPELRQDIVAMDLMSTGVRKGRSGGVGIYLGQHGVVTDLHQDSMTNLYAQVRGEKKWLLFAPTDTPYLCRYPWQNVFEAHRSQLDPLAPDLAAFPEFTKATPLEVRLRPGDLLFLPAFWWHRVESVGETISINSFYRIATNELLSSAQGYARFGLTYGLRALAMKMGIRPS